MKKSFLDYLVALLFFLTVAISPQVYGQTFSASDAGINSGNEVCIDVSVTDFENIVGMQFSMQYDNSLLTYTGSNNLSALSLSAVNFGDITSMGAVTFSWVDPTLTGVFLPDNEIIFSLCFSANSAENTTTTLSFTGNPTPIEIIDNNDQLLNADFNAGSITISAMEGPLEVLNSSVTPDLCGNQNGSIELIVAGGSSPFTYSWQGPDGFISSDGSLFELAAGVYNLTISDADASTLEFQVEVPTETLTLTNAFVTPIGCDMSNGSIDIGTNGANPLFLWNTGEITEDIAISNPGTYSVTITEGNCSLTESFDVLMEDGLAAYAYDCTYFNPDLTEADLHVVLWCGGAPPIPIPGVMEQFRQQKGRLVL